MEAIGGSEMLGCATRSNASKQTRHGLKVSGGGLRVCVEAEPGGNPLPRGPHKQPPPWKVPEHVWVVSRNSYLTPLHAYQND